MRITYPYVHNLSANAPDEVRRGAQAELRIRSRAALRLRGAVRPVGCGWGRPAPPIAAHRACVQQARRPCADVWPCGAQPIRMTIILTVDVRRALSQTPVPWTPPASPTRRRTYWGHERTNEHHPSHVRVHSCPNVQLTPTSAIPQARPHYQNPRRCAPT